MAKTDVIIKFIRQDFAEFKIDNTDWMILSDGLTGIGNININVYTSSLAMSDGVAVTGQSLSARNITLKCKNYDITKNTENREKIFRFFRPKLKYNMYITYNGIQRWIPCLIDGLSLPSGNIFRPLELTLNMLCPNPYFNSVDDYRRDITEIVARWGFPYIATNEIIPVFSTISGNAQDGVKAWLGNDGNVDVPFKMKVKYRQTQGGEGHFHRFSIKLTDNAGNSSYLIVAKDDATGFTANDEIIMDFVDRKFTLNGERIDDLIAMNDETSIDDFKIAMGGTSLQFKVSPSTELDNVDCVLYYNKLYGGI